MMKYLKIYFVAILIINVLAVDIFLYLLWNRKESGVLGQNSNCPTACGELVDNKIKNMAVPTSAVVLATPTTTATATPTVKVVAQSTRKFKTTQYIPIPGTGNTLENKWVDLSGTEFYISTDDYSGLIGSYFEANMKLINGNGMAYLRLFDVTAGVEVWGSEVSTSSQSFTSVSSVKMTIRPGNHLYRVQAKSLTADTTVFNSGRIKVILEN